MVASSRALKKVKFWLLLVRDGNNQMYPIAWVVCERENSVSRAWFVSLLATDLEMQDGCGWCVISNQQKARVDAVKTYLP